jgi:hypothetical protein
MCQEFVNQRFVLIVEIIIKIQDCLNNFIPETSEGA